MSADGATPPPPSPPSPPSPFGNRIPIAIEEEMKSSFMDYAMSVIVSRALPDVRDGLKPVHRRILYTQHAEQQRLEPRRTSSARASSATCSASSTRTATRPPTTPWSAWPRTSRCATRSSTGRATSARSTAIRPPPTGTPSAAWSKIGGELLADIDKETVDFQPNYDDKERRADGPAGALPQPAGQRRRRHRGRHGDQHPAPQPGRDRSTRRSRSIKNPDITIDELMRDRPRPGLPDRRLHLRSRRHPPGLRDGPRRAC